MSGFLRYLIGSTVIGGTVGFAHGYAAFPPGMPNRAVRIYENSLSGALLAPWAPVAVPIYASQWWPNKGECPWLRRTPATPMDMPTVAEKP
jgi:hypothetical protein